MKKEILIALFIIVLVILYFSINPEVQEMHVPTKEDVYSENLIESTINSIKNKQSNFDKTIKPIPLNKDSKELLNFSQSSIDLIEANTRLEIFIKDKHVSKNTKIKGLWELAVQDIDGELFFLCLDYLAELKPLNLNTKLIETYNSISNQRNKIKMLHFFDRILSFSEEEYQSNSFDSEENLQLAIPILEHIQYLTEDIQDKSTKEYKIVTKMYLETVDSSVAEIFIADTFDENNNMSNSDKISLMLGYISNSNEISDTFKDTIKREFKKISMTNEAKDISSMIHSKLLNNNGEQFSTNPNIKSFKDIFIDFELSNKNKIEKIIQTKSNAPGISIHDVSTVSENIAILKYSNYSPKNAILNYIEKDASAFEIASIVNSSVFIAPEDLKNINNITTKLENYFDSHTSEDIGYIQVKNLKNLIAE